MTNISETQRIIDRDVLNAVPLLFLEETEETYEARFLLLDRRLDTPGHINLHKIDSEGGKIVKTCYFSFPAEKLREFADNILAWCAINKI